MKAVLLVNMGSPTSEKEMKIFLKKMFLDKSILNVNVVLRYFLSTLISLLRYKQSWKKYQKIGGSPLIKSMNSIRNDLEKNICGDFVFFCAYSYSNPTIFEIMKTCYNNKILDFIIIPMYPQESFSTTMSIKNTIELFKQKFKNSKIQIISNYYKNKSFILFWVELIREHISKKQSKSTLLLFSAHSIPEYHIVNGDNYCLQINESAKLISENLNCDYIVGYQSKIGRIKWAEPSTKQLLEQLSVKKNIEIVIVPISFLNENLETLYDIDLEIIPYAKSIGINNISRIELPLSNNLLVNTFIEILNQKV